MKPQPIAAQFRMILVLVLVFLSTVFAASHFIYAVHDMPNRWDAFQAMFTYLFGLHYPVVEVAGGQKTEKSRGTPGAKLGGPGIIKVAEDSAAVLVRGKAIKVIGPGTHVAKRGEKIKEAVDLRPQTRTGTVKAMTKDGFEIEIDFIVGFQIDSGGRQSTEEQPYPFSEQAILRAVYQSKQVGKDGAQTWHERVPGAVMGNVREMIASHYLEDFFEPDNPGSNPRTELKQWLVETSKGTAVNVGARLNWVSFSTPKIPDEATKHFLERLQTRTQMTVAQAKAEVEKLKGEVAADRIRQMAEVIQTLDLPPEVIRYLLAHIARHLAPELADDFSAVPIRLGWVSGSDLQRGAPSGSEK
jgi:hypothetical protein